jgi:RND family efflux transporter MFP subunit
MRNPIHSPAAGPGLIPGLIPGLTPVLALALALALAGCRPSEQKGAPASPPVMVEVQPVLSRMYKVPVRATGLLGTATEMKLSFKTGGIVKEIPAREGRSVIRGELLAMLDLSEVGAQVNQANIGLEKAERDLVRARNLYRDSVVTLEQYQNARSGFELAKAQKQIADFNLRHSEIRAPANGKVMKILVETNEVTGPGLPVILFASTENDWVVRASLTDKDIVRLSIGDSAFVSMDPFPDKEFGAVVTELGTVADPVTGTYEAELLILEAHPQFRTGFICRSGILPTLADTSLVVPLEALLEASDRTAYVYLIREGKAERRLVATGPILGDQVAVLEGLYEGDSVITEGVKYLLPGSKVVAVNQQDPLKP